ncbi:MAG: hypothetical protein PHC90_03000 [Syntrophorhabdaceae bacterium]|nr:hypothetical protein [Syntrophorhabdaceae bacterium]
MRKLAIMVVVLSCLSLAAPTISDARRYYGPYRGCHGCGYSNDYWVPAAIVAGTILVGALVVSAVSQSSRQPTQPAYRPIDTSQPYATPDPDFVTRYSKRETPGQWMIVPGQQVGDRWVPAHRVFVPNP